MREEGRRPRAHTPLPPPPFNPSAVAAAVAAAAAPEAPPPADAASDAPTQPSAPAPPSIEVEFTSAPLPPGADAQFASVLARFAPAEEVTGGGEDDANGREDGGAAASSSDDRDDNDATHNPTHLPRRERKALQAAALASLKAAAPRPDLVEAWDVTAPDPGLLACVKAARGVVPVPRHWAAKRAYLQGKRGLDKPPFQLPAYIEATGIGEMRGAGLEADADRSLKQRTRDRVAPKVGRLDIDYQVLHDAFFVHAVKPPLTKPGDLYYEGKEFETRVDVTPGVMSPELRAALGMTGPKSPPPWLINMQRYGPPPAFPRLRIPGLNAPLPAGAVYGYQAGGWGKPPVDGDGRPLYGNPFGGGGEAEDHDADVDKTSLWGELVDVVEEEEEEEEEESEAEEEETADADPTGTASVAASDVSGLASVPAGLDVRKGAAAAAPDAPPPPLYTILEAAPARPGADGAIMGSDHVYVMPATGSVVAAAEEEAPPSASAPSQQPRSAAQKALQNLPGRNAAAPSTVDVAVDPDDLDGLDADAVAALYASRRAAAAAAADDSGVGDVVAARAAAARKRAGDGKGGKKKKGKKDDFKF